ncbi:nucleotidyltransferase family protein [Desulfotomaculum sp. 1211_IL3151]|uniref:nucleotidyltransferase family protein n=1 Tax=Desulfotomaculum sp. 1211_IL3151 TaxID=3084055 RepID=UPI002FD93FED
MVSAVILAAGQAKRMGQPKQLLPLGGKPMVYHVAAAACGAKLLEVIAVTGAAGEQVGQVLTDLPLRISHNENWQKGQASGVRLAVQSLDPRARAVLFLLADQPLVDKQLINMLVKSYQDSGASLVVPRWQNQRGNPVLFDLSHWRADLLQLTGDQGARGIIKAHPQCIHYVDIPSPEIFLDVDTPEEYQQMQKLWIRLRGDSGGRFSLVF